jgi:Tfp pilus assembly protein PilF
LESRVDPDPSGSDPGRSRPEADAPAAATRLRVNRFWPAAALIGAAAAVALAVSLWPAAEKVALPDNAEAAGLYLDARDAWASRDPQGVARAVAKLEAVVRAEPAFAPAHAALADAYILSREFGSTPDSVAFPRARKAAEVALSLDPDLAAAHRAVGFTAYWWERDTAAAGRAFRRSFQLDPQSAQTRFWYGNILADNGEAVAARRELDAARLLDPGSLAIQTDLAWAIWSAGETVEAERRLRDILKKEPSYVGAHDSLSVILLERGDFVGYLEALRARKQMRGEPTLARRLAELDQASRSGDPRAIGSRLVSLARAEEAGKPFPDHSWAAFTASSVGDRRQLGEILALAVANGERWGSAGFRRAIAGRWREDEEVQQALKTLESPRIEPVVTSG